MQITKIILLYTVHDSQLREEKTFALETFIWQEIQIIRILEQNTKVKDIPIAQAFKI